MNCILLSITGWTTFYDMLNRDVQCKVRKHKTATTSNTEIKKKIYVEIIVIVWLIIRWCKKNTYAFNVSIFWLRPFTLRKGDLWILCFKTIMHQTQATIFFASLLLFSQHLLKKCNAHWNKSTMTLIQLKLWRCLLNITACYCMPTYSKLNNVKYLKILFK